MTRRQQTSLLFICMGNICRSPLAEAVFRHRASERRVLDRFVVDSAGTGGWHVGELPDPRMRQIAERYGIKLASHARQVHRDDFDRFDMLICMDGSNRDHLLDMGAPKERVSLLLAHNPASRTSDVPDPYYGGEDGFEHVYQLVDAACMVLLEKLTADRS